MFVARFVEKKRSGQILIVFEIYAFNKWFMLWKSASRRWYEIPNVLSFWRFIGDLDWLRSNSQMRYYWDRDDSNSLNGEFNLDRRLECL